MKIRTASFLSILILFLLLWSSCFWIKAKYDPEGHQYAVSILKEASELMAKARDSFYNYQIRVYKLMSCVEEAYEHSRLFKKNEAITGIWNSLRNPNGNRLAKFMEDWKREDKLSKEFIDTNVEWVQADLKLIIQLEEKKKK